MTIEQPIHILLVEDNEGDIMLTQETFEDANLVVEMSVVRDGKAAIDFLNKTGKYSSVDMPDLVLLDINLPKVSGLDVLSFIKENETIRQTPVIMLSTSSYEIDLKQSKQNRADGYLFKPLAIDSFLDAVAGIDNLKVLKEVQSKLKGHCND